MAHPEGNHLPAVHRVLTGVAAIVRGASDGDRVASRDDFPCYAAALDYVRRREDGIPSGVALPTRLIEGPLTWPGQDAGFLGPKHDPWQLQLDPPGPTPTTRASPCRRASTRIGSIAAGTCSGRSPPYPPATPSSTARTPRSPCSATAGSAARWT